jgi:hypothetical protein
MFFGNTEVSYLGFRLTPSGIMPGKDTSSEQLKHPRSLKPRRRSNLLWDYAIFSKHTSRILLASVNL